MITNNLSRGKSRLWSSSKPTGAPVPVVVTVVLSTQPFTGELSYQPVLQVTRRKPSPMIEIGLGNETIRATRGHPFWVCGEGWKMAKQLTVGMWLHSIGGSVPIERVDQIPAAGPWYDQPDAKLGAELSYNLVLEECHNYFVGQEKILVQDNTLFPLDGPVPAVPGVTAPRPAARPLVTNGPGVSTVGRQQCRQTGSGGIAAGMNGSITEIDMRGPSAGQFDRRSLILVGAVQRRQAPSPSP